MKKMFTKSLLAFLALVLFSTPLVIFASSYYSTLSFRGEHQGATRYYDGNNVGISMTAYTETPQQPHHSTVFITYLYKKKFPFDQNLGDVTFQRNGYNYNKWTNVGSGDFYFLFVKDRDEISVKSDNVYMFSD